MLVEGRTKASRHLWGVLGWGRAPKNPAWGQIGIRNRPFNASYTFWSIGCTCGVRRCRSPQCFRSFLGPCVSVLDHTSTYMGWIYGVDTLYFILDVGVFVCFLLLGPLPDARGPPGLCTDFDQIRGIRDSLGDICGILRHRDTGQSQRDRAGEKNRVVHLNLEPIQLGFRRMPSSDLYGA